MPNTRSSTDWPKSLVVKLIGAAIMLSALALLVGVPATQARTLPGPKVVVVRDVTATLATCTLRYTSGATTILLPCPAGTFLEGIQVPLSEALAKHEHYVNPVASNASHADIAAYEQRLEALKQSVASTFAHPQLAIRPFTNCGTNGTFVLSFSNWHGLTGSSEVDVDRNNSGCNLYEDNSVLDIYTDTQAWWWGSDRYAGSTWNHTCYFLGNGIKNFGNFHLIQGGYTWEQIIRNNSSCSGGTAYWTDVGPLS